MVATKREATAARAEREYPTEWTMYPADEEKDKRREQRSGEQHNRVHAIAVEPVRDAGSTGDRRRFHRRRSCVP